MAGEHHRRQHPPLAVRGLRYRVREIFARASQASWAQEHPRLHSLVCDSWSTIGVGLRAELWGVLFLILRDGAPALFVAPSVRDLSRDDQRAVQEPLRPGERAREGLRDVALLPAHPDAAQPLLEVDLPARLPRCLRALRPRLEARGRDEAGPLGREDVLALVVATHPAFQLLRVSLRRACVRAVVDVLPVLGDVLPLAIVPARPDPAVRLRQQRHHPIGQISALAYENELAGFAVFAARRRRGRRRRRDNPPRGSRGTVASRTSVPSPSLRSGTEAIAEPRVAIA